MLQANNVRVVDLPLRPGAPIRPRVSVNISIGVLLGIILGVLAALARAAMDSTVKTAEEIEQEVGATFLGLLPEINDTTRRGPRARRRGGPGDAPELTAHNFPMSGTSEAARAIRTNLLFMAPDHPFRTLLFTSAGPSEGKTTMACCIAIAIAQAGQRVVLVDCDLRKPRLHRIFRKSAATGVTTALLTESIDDAVHETEVPNLSVITAGPLPPNPAELIHSERFRVFLSQLSKRFDRVILDSPPVVPVTDAAVLSTLVDGTVLVVRAFKTSKELARHAVRALNDVGAKLAGTVLNAVNLNRSEYRYSHYYYYSKDGYYSNEQPPTEPPSPSAPSGEAQVTGAHG
jgi:capsular exopolysaccharide synthesis family protein